MNYDKLFVIMLSFFTLLACAPDISNEERAENSVSVEQDNVPTAPFIQAMLSEVNSLRANGCKCGSTNMPPVGDVVWNEQLAEAAQRHADDLVKHNIFSHIGSDRSEVKDRVNDAGYDWTTVGENVAKGYNTVEGVVSGWQSSEGHCKNMMNNSFKEVGIAQNGVIWVQVLASK
ncbi:MAG: CAP domain-containing protein [Saprospiraceae bacterium]|nr:CAP domain-containing protein [Saprospiraceae bacterium]